MEIILKICVMMEIIGVLLGGYGVCKIVKHKKTGYVFIYVSWGIYFNLCVFYYV